MSYSLEIHTFNFNKDLSTKIQNIERVKNLWPIVYILSDGKVKEAYVGETTDALARMKSHLSSVKKKFTIVNIITSEKFNKSATLDIESNLIKYLSGDGTYALINGNIGLANHNYYQKNELYWDIFKSVWSKLISKGIAHQSIKQIDNSDLFKYSPYKTLSKDQKESLLVIIKNLLEDRYENFIIEGGAGTGKTILAIFLFKLLNGDEDDFNYKEFGEDESKFIRLVRNLRQKNPSPKMAFVIPMSSFRKTIKNVFKNIKGLNSKMVIGPSEIANDKYNIVLVDESHRLRRRVNLGTYFNVFDKTCKKLKCNKDSDSELDWFLGQDRKTIFFYDKNQSIKPSDVEKEKFEKLKINKKTNVQILKSQFRVKGGEDYIDYIEKLLNCTIEKNQSFKSEKYEFLLFDSIEIFIQEIKLRNEKSGLSRIVAGYSWEWVSKKNKNRFDINIENFKLKWNSVSIDWVNSKNSVDEVGCIHTTQGYDLNYTGVIFGKEISYDKEKNEIVINKENYFDKNGKNSIRNPSELKEFIINIYKTLMFRGINGTYVYVCDKNLKEYFEKYIPKFKEKVESKIIYLEKYRVKPFVNSVPIYDLKVAAGNFGKSQNVKDYQWIALPSKYKPSTNLFACTVVGESMNRIIPNGSICLFKKYSVDVKNGDIVLVQHRSIQDADFGSSYTIKKYYSNKKFENEQMKYERITLKPFSHNSEYKNIELTEDESIDLKIIGIFLDVLG